MTGIALYSEVHGWKSKATVKYSHCCVACGLSNEKFRNMLSQFLSQVIHARYYIGLEVTQIFPWSKCLICVTYGEYHLDR